MQILTLTTDFGLDDHYVAALKGHLLSLNNDLLLIDVTHNIKCFDIVQAAFVVKHMWTAYPKGTIHLILVQNQTEPQDLILVQVSEHYFLMPDNGLVTLLFDHETICYRIHTSTTLTTRQLVAGTIDTLVSSGLEAFGEGSATYVRKIHLQPVVTSLYIRGAVVHVDHYDNVIFNISHELFESVSQGRPFELYYKRHDPITRIHKHYYEVGIGEPVCVFNEAGYLVLGINMGRAASLLGLKVDDTVQIHFADEHN